MRGCPAAPGSQVRTGDDTGSGQVMAGQERSGKVREGQERSGKVKVMSGQERSEKSGYVRSWQGSQVMSGQGRNCGSW